MLIIMMSSPNLSKSTVILLLKIKHLSDCSQRRKLVKLLSSNVLEEVGSNTITKATNALFTVIVKVSEGLITK